MTTELAVTAVTRNQVRACSTNDMQTPELKHKDMQFKTTALPRAHLVASNDRIPPMYQYALVNAISLAHSLNYSLTHTHSHSQEYTTAASAAIKDPIAARPCYGARSLHAKTGTCPLLQAVGCLTLTPVLTLPGTCRLPLAPTGARVHTKPANHCTMAPDATAAIHQ